MALYYVVLVLQPHPTLKIWEIFKSINVSTTHRLGWVWLGNCGQQLYLPGLFQYAEKYEDPWSPGFTGLDVVIATQPLFQTSNHTPGFAIFCFGPNHSLLIDMNLDIDMDMGVDRGIDVDV